MDARAQALLDFWFGADETPRAVWFETDPAFDTACEDFLADHARAAAGLCDPWADTADGALALILLLDQIPRNCFRATKRAYATDAKAREVTRFALARGLDRKLPPMRRHFVYLPLEHSESLADQEEMVRLAATLDDHPEHGEIVEYATRHRDIIARFGRFPHRNAALGRATTPEEATFLQEPNSSF
jgi:uncharacterized protein (DUF924 family)